MEKNEKIVTGVPLSEELRQSKYPFIIHAYPLTRLEPLFPTHTHGLNKEGWPEFIMAPLSSGPYGTCDRTNSTYCHFKKPKNRKKLNQILSGKIIEIPITTLNPNWGNSAPNYTLCFRKVENNFEAVRQAYDVDNSGAVDPDLVVVQIWVKGDSFALTDEYYRGGIKW